MSGDPELDAVKATRETLWRAGFRPLAVWNADARNATSPGKQPAGQAWQDMARKDPPQAVTAPVFYKALNTGILCDGLRALDIDIDDQALASEIEALAQSMLGIGPVRGRSNSGKRLIVYRAAEGEPKKRAIGGDQGKIEALGRGQQFVAYGDHPSGVPYEWRDGIDLTAAVRDDLPAISEDQLSEFLDACAPLIGAKRATVVPDRRSRHVPSPGTTETPKPASGLPATSGARERACAAKALSDEASRVAAAGEGQRNDTLNVAAFNLGQMVASGWIASSDVEAALAVAAHACGLDPLETRAIRSGLEAGAKQPRGKLEDRNPSSDMATMPITTINGITYDPATGEVIGAATDTGALIAAEPFTWTDPQSIPPRAWLYGRHYIRGFVSATFAPGGVGKSALTMCEGMAIATGRPLLGIEPDESARVWIVNLEDPMDELYRRAMAIASHYGLDHRALNGRLFLNSGRTTPLVIATSTKAGTTIAKPVVEAIIAEVERHKIGLIIVDPFVASHAVPENDNSAINDVLTAWRNIAERTECAIELVHHTRKTLGGPITVEDGRGGNALPSGTRSTRAINRMTDSEAAKAGVDSHRSFFRIDDADGKANMSPPSSKAAWYQIVSVDLGNQTATRHSDHVGVVTRWHWPDPMADVTADHLGRVLTAISGGNYRKDVQATDWAGHAVGNVIGIDTGQGLRGEAVTAAHKAARSKVSGLIAVWLKNGALRTEMGTDAKGNDRIFVRVGDACAE